MGWFSRRERPEPPPPDPRAGRLGPEPTLPRTPESPGLSFAPIGEAATLGALLGLEGPAAGTAIAEALHGVSGTAPVPGIAGLRVLHREAALVVLRLGPPPGARWALRDVRAIAVYAGKLTLVDGDEPHLLRAGFAARPARPRATLFLEAGNDSALGLALAGPAFAATLG